MPGESSLKARTLRRNTWVATALKVGRLKDLARVQAFLDQKAVDLERLDGVMKRHNLADAWKVFCTKAGVPNPLENEL